MTEFVAAQGGRLLSIEDIENLQNLSLSWGEVLKPYGSFVVSGCIPTIEDVQNRRYSISSGYMFIDGKICWFDGASNVSVSAFIIVDKTTVNSEYEDGVSRPSRYIYKAKKTLSLANINESQRILYVCHPGGEIVYPTFQSKVLDNDFIKDNGSLVDVLSAIKTNGGYIQINDNAQLKATENSLSIMHSPNLGDVREYQLSFSLNHEDKSATLAFGPSVDDSRFECGQLRCNDIVPLEPTALHTVEIDGVTYKRSGTPINIAANQLTVNGEPVALKSSLQTNSTLTKEYGSIDLMSDDYCKLFLSKIGKSVTVSGYIRLGNYQPSSGEVVRLNVSFGDKGLTTNERDIYGPAINTYLPAFISQFGSDSNISCYVSIDTNGRICYCIVNRDMEQGDALNMTGLTLNFSGSYVSAK